MCGIVGAYSNHPTQFTLIKNATRAISHRGPDEQGFFKDNFCTLGMCRLAIIDISTGQQPSYNARKDIVSVFNGEIYNFRELRQALMSRGHKIKGLGDAALIPFLYQEYGENFVSELQGMFAIAIYDLKRRTLLLFRDRLGKKPLWYSLNGNSLFFSSEVKALLSLGMGKTLNESIIPEYLRYGYINAPRSAYLDLQQLPPASTLTFHEGHLNIRQYWSPADVQPLSITFEEAKAETLRLLRDAVNSRLVSERPIGAFLSGGIDSTIVTSLMKEFSDTPIHTFSIGFTDKKFDESKFAQEVAKEIGTIHHELIIEPDPRLIIEEIAGMLDQPFADSSIIPTYMLSKFSREKVVVALSGDGGDEGFAGYERYRASRMLDSINSLLAINPIQYFPPNRISNPRLSKLVRHSGALSLSERYKGIQSLFQERDIQSFLNPDLLNRCSRDYFIEEWETIETKDSIRRMQIMDLKTYLPGDLMYKVDMSSMANSLEVRSPFLDYRLVEFGLSLPSSYKIHRGQSKYILREIVKDLVPGSLIDRRKMGFAIPRGRWLRQELKDMVTEVLLDDVSRRRQWYRFDKVEEMVKRHNQGFEYDSLIWPMLMLELWAKKWID